MAGVEDNLYLVEKIIRLELDEDSAGKEQIYGVVKWENYSYR